MRIKQNYGVKKVKILTGLFIDYLTALSVVLIKRVSGYTIQVKSLVTIQVETRIYCVFCKKSKQSS
ncbi:MAG: hypothetical protein HDT30_07275 [Clostridiales bacterium]|nr:hypothetical protein [Clostridiales bacterium]